MSDYPYPCAECGAPNKGWRPGQICTGCASDDLDEAMAATADELYAGGVEMGYSEASCVVCRASFRAEADYETRCGECQRAHEEARDADDTATVLAVRLIRACAHAAELRRVAAMTPDERVVYWAERDAEAEHL